MKKRNGPGKGVTGISRIPRAVKTEIERPRLLKILKKQVNAKLLALLAPSGYGKTTLLAQFARSLRQPVAWLALGADDAEALTCAGSVARAIRETLPDLLLLHWDAAVQAKASPDGLAKALAADLEPLEFNLCLVLDETQHLGTRAGQWLERFTQALPEGHLVLLTGFDRSALPLTRLVAAGDAVILGVEELRFTVTETRALLKASLVAADPDRLTRSLEGWCAGVALAVQSRGEVSAPEFLIADCLARLTESVRLALPEASVAVTWDEASLQQLGVDLPAGWLREVLSVGLPLMPLEVNVYRPHDLLRSALDVKLQQRPARFKELLETAARLELEHGRKLGAVQLFQRAGNQDAALQLALEIVGPLGERGEFKLVRGVLEQFPEDQLPPNLLVRWAQALLETGDAPRGDVLVRRLYADGSRDPSLLYQLAILEYRHGRYDRLLECVAEGLASRPTPKSEASLRLLESAGLEALGHFPEGLRAGLEAVRIAEGLNDLPLLAATLTGLASSYAENNQRLECERTFLRAIELTERLVMDQRLLPNLNNLANHYSDWGRVSEAIELVNRGLDIAEREPNFWQPILLGTRGLQFLRSGDFAAAIADFQRGLELCPKFDLAAPVFNYLLWQAEAWRLGNQLIEAQRCVDECRVKSMATESYFQSRLEAMDGLIAFSRSDLNKAKQHFAAVDVSQLDWWDQPRFKAHNAELARLQGLLTEADVNAFCLDLDGLGHDTPLYLDNKALQGLFQVCIERGWQAERFQQLLLSSNQPVLANKQPLELMVNVFGRISVGYAGAFVQIPLAKSTELLVWLVLHGSGSRDQLITALWDGSRNAKNVHYFKVVVRQLRLALSQLPDVTFNPLLFEQDLYRLHSDLRVLLDATAFQKPQLTDVLAIVPLLELYQGEFMPGFDSEWILETRTHFHDQAVTLNLQLARHLEAEQPLEAIQCYQRVLELDEVNDTGFDGLMRVYSSIGDTISQQSLQAAKSRVLAREYGVVRKSGLRAIA